LRSPEREGTFAQTVRDELEHFLGGPGDDGNHDQGKPNPTGEGGKMFERHHYNRVNENTGHNRWNPG
jgi:hypothetical protein